MKLSVSNIAWPAELDAEVYALLRERGVRAVEIAPTRIWPDWKGATPWAAAELRRELQREGLVCSSLQAIVYGRPDLKLFGSAEERAAAQRHLEGVVRIAAALGAGPLVFGAPANRDRGELDAPTAFARAVDFFAEAGECCVAHGVELCIEPNPVDYGCNFVTTSGEGAALVRAVASPGFRLHLDAAGMHLAGEDPRRALGDAADVLAHVHVSEPRLGDFSAPAVDHRRVAEGLRAIGWERWLSIEMRATPDSAQDVARAVDFALETYGARSAAAR